MRIREFLSFVIKVGFVGFDFVCGGFQPGLKVDWVKELRRAIVFFIKLSYRRLLLQDMQLHNCRCVINGHLHSHVEKSCCIAHSRFPLLVTRRVLMTQVVVMMVVPRRL
jgi:hypothetical protein